jgi:hypothetical protein
MAVRFVLLLAAFAATLSAQVDLGELYSAGRYSEVVAAADETSDDQDLLFLRGMSLARLDRWAEAEQALRQGQSLAPEDARFPTELAGVSYRLEDYRQSRRFLRRALRLAPDNEYARNFLGSLYLLDSNLDAALAQWNRIDQPRLSAVELPLQLRTDPVLLDRALTFSPATTLELSQLRTSRARLNLLDAFSGYDFDLVPNAPGDDYKLRMRGSERSGLFRSPLWSLARSARGLPYRTVFLEHDNGGGNASSLHAIARWDPWRRRANVVYSRPLVGEARYRWRVFGDAREERWDLTYRIPELPNFRLQKVEAGAGFESVVNGSFRWGAEAAASVRSFRGAGTDGVRMPDAAGARTDVTFNWTPLYLPARRIAVTTETRVGLGSVADDEGTLYGRAESAAQLRWSSGGNWSFTTRISGGVLPGRAPFDELYILGVERDNELVFRGIRNDQDGRKGSAPVGDRFWLSSTDLIRRVAHFALADIHAGPFFDAGVVRDSRGEFGSPRTQLAAGVQVELRLFGAFGIRLLYGRDLRTGQDLFFSRPYPDRDLVR